MDMKAPVLDHDPLRLDLARMRAERRRKLHDGMEKHGLDALVLLGTSAVRYATGHESPSCDSATAAFMRPIAVVVGGDDLPHLFTSERDTAPPELQGDHVHPPLSLELPDADTRLAARLAELLPRDTAGARVAVDELTAVMLGGLRNLDMTDASVVLGPARVIKTPDEIDCIRRAQRLNEIAMHAVQQAALPGVRQSELTGLFLQRVFELGATGFGIDPIWQVMPARINDGPFTTNGDVAYPLVSCDRILEEGDIMWVDSGITYHGYNSDFGRTWLISSGRPVTSRRRDQYRRWREIMETTLAEIRPGATGRDLVRAATRANAGHRPWLRQFYLAHGIGLDSAEAPLIGTDLGEEFDESLMLAAGMVVVLEPVVWDDGHCGYRSEDIVAVVDDGYVELSNYPYEPYAP